MQSWRQTLLVPLALALAAACTRSAYTGRFRSTPETSDEDLLRAERAVASYTRDLHPVSDPGAAARVDRVAHALVEAAKAGPAGERAASIPWKIVVVESPETTVASFANGVIVVHAGVVRILPSDDALAATVGQAVARVLLRHDEEVASRRASRRFLPAIAEAGAGSFGSSRSELEATQAAEADWVGLVLAVEAGYDPDRAVEAFDRLGLRERGEAIRERLPELRARAADTATLHVRPQ